MFFISVRFLTPPLGFVPARPPIIRGVLVRDLDAKLKKRKPKTKLPRLVVKKTARQIATKVAKEAKKRGLKVSRRNILYEVEVLLYIVIVEIS